MQSKLEESQKEEALNKLCEISFHSEYSYELLVSGPMLLPTKPDQVPYLNLDDLPQYESSSEEQEQTQQEQYDESMKYISSYY